MLFSVKSELLLFAILPWVFEHVLVISGDSSVFMFCYALPAFHAHACFGACNMPSCCFGQIVVISCIEFMC